VRTGGAARPLIRVLLKYGPGGEKVISGIQRVSRPGRRVYLRPMASARCSAASA
jgi:small subunit ribosomal protein S8